MIRDGGFYYVIGYGENINIPTIDVISREISFIGNLVGTYTDLEELMTLTAQGQVTPAHLDLSARRDQRRDGRPRRRPAPGSRNPDPGGRVAARRRAASGSESGAQGMSSTTSGHSPTGAALTSSKAARILSGRNSRQRRFRQFSTAIRTVDMPITPGAALMPSPRRVIPH